MTVTVATKLLTRVLLNDNPVTSVDSTTLLEAVKAFEKKLPICVVIDCVTALLQNNDPIVTLSSNTLSPLTCNFKLGLVVPIPIFPPVVIIEPIVFEL